MLKKFGLVKTQAKAVKPRERYGRLKVVAVGQTISGYKYYAICRCVCGSDPKPVRFDSLKSGAIQSCGCLQEERNSTHNLTVSPHYNRWRHMMDRCYKPSDKRYHNYGGRGIKVCKEWHNVEAFIGQLPEGYFPGVEIDRIDNDGNYEPGNVQWSTKKENCNNRSSTKLITFDGETKSIQEWATEKGINYGTLHDRLYRGWSIEDALSQPTNPKSNLITWNGETKPASAWARTYGITVSTFLYRLRHGWTIEEALSISKYQKNKSPSNAKRYQMNGEYLTIKEISEKTGISIKLLRKRIQERKWSMERATSFSKKEQSP